MADNVTSNLNSLYSKVVEPPLDALGLLDSPVKRFFAFSVGTELALQYFKPAGLFDDKGVPKPSSLLDPNAANSVPLNVYMVSGLIGLCSVVFI